ncbi:MAG: DUF4271 domain-containing protein [Chitinophagales bacterium]|nr:DUF4271 domain-containing protein [Chitinophagales bacterium]
MRTLLFISILLALLLTPEGILNAQNQQNPFELIPRLDLPPESEETSQIADTGNPFDIIPPRESARPVRPDLELKPDPVKRVITQPNRRLLLITNTSLLILLTILVTLLRSQLGRTYRAFLNDNLLAQLQRERETVGGIPYYLFYIFAILSIGFFVFLIVQEFEYSFYTQNPWKGLGISIGLLAVLLLAKHTTLSLIGYIFPIQKEIALYSMTIIVFSIIIGIILIPINLLVSFAPEGLTRMITYIALAIIILIYLFRSLRGLFIANKFILFHKFHFLLYICTVEVVPIAIIARVILG